jgi:purine-nucleoside phosphorylase
MYKTFTADDYRNHHKLPEDYIVNGFIIFGTFHPGPYDQLRDELVKLNIKVDYSRVLEGPYFEPILEFTVGKKRYWFTVAYGGTMLSEWTHLACLFGSQVNVVIGSCGGLFKDADSPDIVVPTYAYADESATRMYEPEANHQHMSDENLNKRLIKKLEQEHKVWHGPTITCQAMMAETWDDIQKWSNEGYYAVEMEAATVFAVSNHFKVSSAALLVIGDNLVQEKTVLDVNYEAGGDTRQQIRREMLAEALQYLLDIRDK